MNILVTGISVVVYILCWTKKHWVLMDAVFYVWTDRRPEFQTRS